MIEIETWEGWVETETWEWDSESTDWDKESESETVRDSSNVIIFCFIYNDCQCVIWQARPRAEIKKHLKLLLSLAPLRASWQQHSSSEQQLHVMIESRWPSKRPRPSKNEEAESKIEDELWMWFWSEDDVKCKNQTS